jgi:uncharacterized damage-inducible protein DinB
MESNLQTYFERLYTYNRWANDTLLNHMHGQNAANHPEVMKLMSHLLSAQEIWISRIQGREAEVQGVWTVFNMNECHILANFTADNWLNYIAHLSPEALHHIIAYKNTMGEYYETPVIDIMCHCVNHATYHRAQVTRLMRQAGMDVVNTDFITYARKFALPVLAV